jgi:PhzF family phenazine biosynthesis protein
MRTQPIYQVDAFTQRAFGGNPAGVCPLSEWLPDEILRDIAAEMNLAETAFFVRRGEEFELRWFTPEVEVDLCGHATLASAFVLFNELEPGRREARFTSRSGPLAVSSEGERLTLDFPALPPKPVAAPDLVAALGAAPKEILLSRDVPVAVFGSAREVRALKPDMAKIAALPGHAVSVTAEAGGEDKDVDFVSRFFAPKVGIPEDPVTGSAHCALIPLWAARLGKTRLRARQVSRRVGELWCELRGDRVAISGHAVLTLRGALFF